VAVPGISINGILEQEPADVTVAQCASDADTDADSNNEMTSPGSSGMFGYDCANLASLLTDTSRNSDSSSHSSSDDSDGG
jgi:hypothetical protein